MKKPVFGKLRCFFSRFFKPADIEKLSLEELFDLNRRVIRRIEYLRSLHLYRFEVGDRVSFQNAGQTVEGAVIRINRKTISVDTPGVSWRLPPHLLTKLTVPKAKLHPDTVDIIEVKEEK